MTSVFVVTQDVCPESIMALWPHWDQVKKHHPDLKLTCFVPARFKNKVENDVYKSKFFRDWWKERKDWVEVAAHGLYHQASEFRRFRKHQERYIERMSTKLRHYLPRYPGFMPPFLKYKDFTFDFLEKAGYAYVVLSQRIYWLREMQNAQLIPPFILVHTHTNVSDSVVDNINECKVTLHKRLLHYEKRRCTFSTISEYVERWRE